MYNLSRNLEKQL
jgi:hypothetical protein